MIFGCQFIICPNHTFGWTCSFSRLVTKQKSHSLSTWETYGELQQVIWLIRRSCHKYYDQYQIEAWLLLRKLLALFSPSDSCSLSIWTPFLLKRDHSFAQTPTPQAQCREGWKGTSVDRGYPLLYRSKQLNSDSKPAIPNQQNKKHGN